MSYEANAKLSTYTRHMKKYNSVVQDKLGKDADWIINYKKSYQTQANNGTGKITCVMYRDYTSKQGQKFKIPANGTLKWRPMFEVKDGGRLSHMGSADELVLLTGTGAQLSATVSAALMTSYLLIF